MTPADGPEDFDYDLPDELIARYPAHRRDESRMLVLTGDRGAPRHARFRRIARLVGPGDLLVVNESKVFPARLLGRKPTGAACEVLLLRPLPDTDRRWEALVRPGGKLKPGRSVEVGPTGALRVEILDSLSDGLRIVELHTDLAVPAAIDRYGRVPLPPYLGRESEPIDRDRYQTVYARTPGSVAAPTAGLHFTPELLDDLRGRGAKIAPVTLHVGPGTFRPVETERIDEYELHAENFSVPESTADAVNETRAAGGKIWAVGTTSVRSLEAAAAANGHLRTVSGSTDLFIRPGYRFRVVDRLITNFHLPRSSLLMLVSAFAGRRRILAAYREAVAKRYRFYSYGDAMAIVP